MLIILGHSNYVMFTEQCSTEIPYVLFDNSQETVITVLEKGLILLLPTMAEELISTLHLERSRYLLKGKIGQFHRFWTLSSVTSILFLNAMYCNLKVVLNVTVLYINRLGRVLHLMVFFASFMHIRKLILELVIIVRLFDELNKNLYIKKKKWNNQCKIKQHSLHCKN